MPLLVVSNSRLAIIVEGRIRVGSEEFKSNTTNTTLALAKLLEPVKETNESAQHLDESSNTPHESGTTPNVIIHLNNTTDRIILELISTFAYWWDTQSRFCDLIRQVTNVWALGKDLPYHIRNHQPPPLSRSTFDCVSITTSSVLGTGNRITAFYAMRMVAALGMVDFEIQCQDGMTQGLHHLISWFTGYCPSRKDIQRGPTIVIYATGWAGMSQQLCQTSYRSHGSSDAI